MSERELIALLNDTEIGRVLSNRHGRLVFRYADAWRNAANAYPLSLSMSLANPEHDHPKIEPFLWGLLPDNPSVLQRWGSRFQVSPRNPFALLEHVGEDCAGAVQFVRPEKLNALRGGRPRKIEWLDESGVAERLKLLRGDHSAWRAARDAGQFSLAGAQPKTALLFEKDRWGIPSGRTPTTHILKPPNGHLDGFVENEHFCLELTRALGLPAVDSKVLRFGDEIAIVVERYDRFRSASGWTRIHQEDVCQALGLAPTRKYQDDGGPGSAAIIELLRTSSRAANEDVATFINALALNWLIAGTDAHAKNYSLLMGTGGQVRLAPLYDVASVLPYRQFDINQVKLAMKVGDKYRMSRITARDWAKSAVQLKVDPDEVLLSLVRMAKAIPDLAAAIAKRVADKGLNHPVIDRLVLRLSGRARLCLTKLR